VRAFVFGSGFRNKRSILLTPEEGSSQASVVRVDDQSPPSGVGLGKKLGVFYTGFFYQVNNRLITCYLPGGVSRCFLAMLFTKVTCMAQNGSNAKGRRDGRTNS
jgi:hypothetical protein